MPDRLPNFGRSVMHRLIRDARSAELLRTAQGTPFGNYDTTPPVPHTNTTVRVTGAKYPNGLYPAVLTYLNLEGVESSTGPVWYDGDVVAAFPTNDNEALEIGKRYDARFEGYLPDESTADQRGMAVFRAGGLAADYFHARLTSTDGTGWNFFRLKLTSLKVYADDGDEVTGYRAVALKPDENGTKSWTPRIGMHVWVKYDPDVDLYEFLSRYELLHQVCVIPTYVSGTLTGFTVTNQRLLNDGTVACDTNPADCCPVTTPCCPGYTIPSTLYGRLRAPCGPASNEPLAMTRAGTAMRWTGAGACSGGSGENSDAPCYAGGPHGAGTTLVATLTNLTGGCASGDCGATRTAAWDNPGGVPQWNFSQASSDCYGDYPIVLYDCTPPGGNYTINVGPGSGAFVTLVSSTESPFSLVYDVVVPPNGAGGVCAREGGSYRLTITEAP